MDYQERHQRLLRRRVLRYVHQRVPTVKKGNGKHRWDGDRLSLATPVENQSYEEHTAWLVHDVSHYRVCPEERRGLPEFGLGSPDNLDYEDPEVPTSVCDRDEELATALDMLVMTRLRFPNWAITEWWEQGFWKVEMSERLPVFYGALLTLVRLGIPTVRELLELSYAREILSQKHGARKHGSHANFAVQLLMINGAINAPQ